MSACLEGAVAKKFTISQQRRMVAAEDILMKNGLSRFIPTQNCIFCPGSKAFSTPFRGALARHLTKKHQVLDRALEQAGQIWETLSSEQETLCQIHNINLDYLKVDEKSSSESEESGDDADDQGSEPLTEPEHETEDANEEVVPKANDNVLRENVLDAELKCKDCGQKFKSQVQLKTHTRRYCRLEMPCEHCSRVFKIREGEASKMFSRRIQTHRGRCLTSRRRLNPKPSSFMCEKCSKVFAQSRLLKQHYKRCSIVHECEGCGLIFKRNYPKRKHEGKCRAYRKLQRQRALHKTSCPSLVASATLRSPKKRFAPPRESDFIIKHEIEVKEEPVVESAENCEFISVAEDTESGSHSKIEPLEASNSNMIIVSIGGM